MQRCAADLADARERKRLLVEADLYMSVDKLEEALDYGGVLLAEASKWNCTATTTDIQTEFNKRKREIRFDPESERKSLRSERCEKTTRACDDT